jgi:glutamyl-tRNA synthetase
MAEPEMIELFSMEGIQKKPAVFDTTKLEWMNGQYLSMLPEGVLEPPVRRELARMGVDAGSRNLGPAIFTVKARSRTILDIANQVAIRIVETPPKVEPKADKFISSMTTPAFVENLESAKSAFVTLPAEHWSSSNTLSALQSVAQSTGKKLGDIMQPIRIALTGSTVSEPVNELVSVVGKESTIRKIDNFVQFLRNPSSGH